MLINFLFMLVQSFSATAAPLSPMSLSQGHGHAHGHVQNQSKHQNIPIIRHTIQSGKYKSCRVWWGELIVTLTMTLRSIIKVISRSNRCFQMGTITFDLVNRMSGKFYVQICPSVKVIVKVIVSFRPVKSKVGDNPAS